MPRILLSLIIIGVFFHLSAEERIGLIEDCANTDGWFEYDKDHKEIAPRVKMESKDGRLHIQLNRGLLYAARKHSWVQPGVYPGSILRKKYKEVDLDKYPYLVVSIVEKGSGIFFGVNGYDTKAGYRTGITAVDLRHYDNDAIHGKKPISFEVDLHDNSTTCIIDEIKLVSQLTAEEQKGLIDQGLTIRNENLEAENFHGLTTLKERRQRRGKPIADEEFSIYRDTATGAIITKLTDYPGNDYLAEGPAWSADGEAFVYNSKRGSDIGGLPICYPGKWQTKKGPQNAYWRLWSNVDGNKLGFMSRKGKQFTVSQWNESTQSTTVIGSFEVPKVGGYTEFKNQTPDGKQLIGFRETPYFYLVDFNQKKIQAFTLPTPLKDVNISKDGKDILWGNCYTYEGRWKSLDGSGEGIASRFNVGHASHGQSGMVGSFGGNLKIFVPPNLHKERVDNTAVTIWANWQNKVSTDYGRVTVDNKYIFTNGLKGDVKNQHVMIPSADTGAVLRITRYFTKFSWSSTTYSRPSPDYTKLLFNENWIGDTDMHMAYTRLPDAPQNVKLSKHTLNWKPGTLHKEIKGYHVYASQHSDHAFKRINDQLITDTSFTVNDGEKYYRVCAVEHSGLESALSHLTSNNKHIAKLIPAEHMQFTAPARQFFDGYAHNFQCLRINAQSKEEQKKLGAIKIKLPSDKLVSIWLRCKGTGAWKLDNESVAINAADWKWIKVPGRWKDILVLSSSDDALMLDSAFYTSTDHKPRSHDPLDAQAPAQAQDITAHADGEHVQIRWNAVADRDLHHYDIHVSETADFKPSNKTLLGSVNKTSFVDSPATTATNLHYKIIAVDQRFNAGAASTCQFKR